MKIVGAVVLTDNERKILIGKRPEGKDLAGYWEFPGGKLEAGETIEECIVREIYEELNVRCEVGNFIMDVAKVYPHGEFIIKVFFGKISDVENLKANVHQELKWVSKEELKDYVFPPADAEIIDYLIEKY